jgi:hypothetical protein
MDGWVSGLSFPSRTHGMGGLTLVDDDGSGGGRQGLELEHGEREKQQKKELFFFERDDGGCFDGLADWSGFLAPALEAATRGATGCVDVAP